MELVSLRCNRDFTSASSYGLGWYKYAIATQWYQFHTTDAWWFSLNITARVKSKYQLLKCQHSLQHVRNHFEDRCNLVSMGLIVNINEWWTVCVHHFVVYFLSCDATRKINTKITLKWAHKQFVTAVHTLFYFLHNIRNPYMVIKKISSHINSMPHMLCWHSVDDITIVCAMLVMMSELIVQHMLWLGNFMQAHDP